MEARGKRKSQPQRQQVGQPEGLLLGVCLRVSSGGRLRVVPSRARARDERRLEQAHARPEQRRGGRQQSGEHGRKAFRTRKRRAVDHLAECAGPGVDGFAGVISASDAENKMKAMIKHLPNDMQAKIIGQYQDLVQGRMFDLESVSDKADFAQDENMPLVHWWLTHGSRDGKNLELVKHVIVPACSMLPSAADVERANSARQAVEAFRVAAKETSRRLTFCEVNQKALKTLGALKKTAFKKGHFALRRGMLAQDNRTLRAFATYVAKDELGVEEQDPSLIARVAQLGLSEKGMFVAPGPASAKAEAH